MSAIETAREALLSQLEPLELEYAATKERLEVIVEVKAQLEGALKALSVTKKANGKAARKAAKPFARKSDVMEVCLALVAANQPIAKDDLESLTKHKLAADGGFNLSGVRLRYSECMASDAFIVGDDDMVSMASGVVQPSLTEGAIAVNHDVQKPVDEPGQNGSRSLI